MNCFQPIEHSKNRIITQSGMFENEIGPRVLQSSIRQARVTQEYEWYNPCATDFVAAILSVLFEIFSDFMFVEH